MLRENETKRSALLNYDVVCEELSSGNCMMLSRSRNSSEGLLNNRERHLRKYSLRHTLR